MNVVIKSGTNRFHGAGYEYFSNNALNANTSGGANTGVGNSASGANTGFTTKE